MVSTKNKVTFLKRKDLCTLRRLRIGHTSLTHRHLLNKENPPVCETCNIAVTVKHVLVDCPGYKQERNRHQLDNCLVDLLKMSQDKVHRLLQFLKDIKLYNQIS